MKMKKMMLMLPTVLLAVFIAGCGKTPDQKLKEKVPDSTNSLCLFDGSLATQTNLYKNNKNDILKGLKESGLPENIFQCRILLFGSTKEQWGGALIQSAEKQARILYDKFMAECKKDKNTFTNFKEIRTDKENRATATVNGKNLVAILYDDDLMLIAFQKTDPAFFNAAKPNPVFQDIQMKNSILSAAIKVEIPQDGKGKDSADMAAQMVPALKKMTALSLNIPFSADDPVMEFRMILSDDSAAGEMLAAVNMGIGFAAQSSKEFADFTQKMQRKTEKNVLFISFKLKDLETLGKQVQEANKKKEQLKAARRKQKAQKKALSAQKKAAKPAASAQKTFAPANKNQPAVKPAVPAQKTAPANKTQPAVKPAAPAQKTVAPANKTQPAPQAAKPAAPAQKIAPQEK